MFSGLDVQHYLQKNNIAVDDDFLKPMTNPDIISHLLKELSKCFNSQQNLYKMYELLELSKNMKS